MLSPARRAASAPACPKGCAGMGERMCNEHAECDGGSYGTVCRPKPYCQSGGGGVILDLVPDSSSCGCDAGVSSAAASRSRAPSCAAAQSADPRSRIIDDPAFRLASVLGRLAPDKLDDFTRALLRQIGEPRTLGNGAIALSDGDTPASLPSSSPTWPASASGSRACCTPALINRVDLAKPGTCGEARLTFYALTRAYTDGNQRMTMIVELRVPDDGNGCRSVASAGPSCRFSIAWPSAAVA